MFASRNMRVLKTSETINRKFPVLIDGLPSPDIFVYSIEAVIAEKFEAAITLGMINSRLKDYFDIYMISANERIEGSKLKQQVVATILRRGTVLHINPYIFSKDILNDVVKSQEWDVFYEKLGRNEHISFADVLVRIRRFLEPLYLAIVENTEFIGVWDVVNAKWST